MEYDLDLERKSIKLRQKPALVVVDMIKGFTDPECPLGSESATVVDANIQLLAAMRELDLPIFFTTVVYETERQAKVFRERIPALELLKPTSKWVEIEPALERRNSEPVIEKQWASAFFKTSLSDQLTQSCADSLIITGLTTSGCVRASVVDGLQYDYPVVVAQEAVGDRNMEAHAANLFDMHAKYADVMSLKDVLKNLQNL